jgi:aryl-alcohol dehydrogenase-like predicted oxidoreductase
MDHVSLGRTGLQVSVLGLGGGGHSRLGQRTGATEAESIALVRRALSLGVTFFDTAESYGTEALIGAALHEVDRTTVVLSTKKAAVEQGRPISAAELRRGLEESLRRLRTDYVDVFHLHGVRADQYDHAVAELVPEMQRLRTEGKIRFLGITEAFGADPGHVMMARAARDPVWDVVMVGFNILNQSARERVFAETSRRGIGVLCMFAVRAALSQPDKLRQTVAELAGQGALDPEGIDVADQLGFLGAVAESLPDAAYRFCRAEPAIDVVLSGTGNLRHLEHNVASILRPPLPAEIRQRLIDLFARVDTVSGQ